jgi:hypothetical protein
MRRPGLRRAENRANFSAGQGEELEDIVVSAPGLQHARKILLCKSSRRSGRRQLSEAIQCLPPDRSEAGQLAHGWLLIYHIVSEGVEILNPPSMHATKFIAEPEQLTICPGRSIPRRLL